MEQVLSQIPEFLSPANLRFLVEAMGVTIALTFFGCGLGFLLAFFVVFARQTPGHWALPLRAAAILFVEIFRRIPFLVTIYLVLFGLAVIVKNASLFAIALIAICIYATAYSADIIRGGFESVPRQQIEAARSMNFGRWRTLIYVIVPQSWPVILLVYTAVALLYFVMSYPLTRFGQWLEKRLATPRSQKPQRKLR
jgi:polar amino acid transport system permease protein